MTIKEKIMAKRRIEKLSSVLHNDDVIYTIVADVESYVKTHCSIPSDFNFNEFEMGLIKTISLSLSEA
jgi:hypothetical protein